MLPWLRIISLLKNVERGMGETVGISKENIVEMLRQIYLRMDEQKEYLSKLDTEIGDGDHGFSLANGFRKLNDKLEEYARLDTGEMLKKCGFELIKTVGGAAGAVFGTFFTGQATLYNNDLKGKDTLSLSDFSSMLSHALAEIKKRGSAKPGDKTMVDALQPAVQELTSAANDNLSFSTAFRRAAVEAERGAEKTREMVATHGRAKNLGERSIGYMDPGAASIALIIKTMAEYFQTLGI
jgi:dihydroxyacetone kinase-like protein